MSTAENNAKHFSLRILYLLK